MSAPTELLEKKIRRREDALRARQAETAAREAELQDLKESLQKLQSARSGIRGAIEDALSSEPTTTIAPTDLLEMAVEGNTNSNPFANGNITAEEVVKLALISMRKYLGRKGLVKMIVQTAVQASQLDAEGVIKAALETVRSCDLNTSDVVRAALQASRNYNHIFAADIIPPAVSTAIERGIEPPVVVKEAFVSAVRGNPSTVKTSVLSVLGCAMGMGMDYRDIKSIMKAFSKEIKIGEATEVRQSIAANAAGPSKVVQLQSPESRSAKQIQSESPKIVKSHKPQETPKPRSSKKDVCKRDDVDSSVVDAMAKGALESIDSGGPGMRALGDPFMMVAQWPGEYFAADKAVKEVLADRARAKAQSANKPTATYSDDDHSQEPASKKAKLKYRRDDRRGKGQ